MDKNIPTLYILMRNDLASMNAGKAMAQASHASNFAVKQGVERGTALIEGWRTATNQGYGTVLVLSVDHEELKIAMLEALKFSFLFGLVVDPSYPYSVQNEIAELISGKFDTIARWEKNGVTYLHRKETTCGFILANSNDPCVQRIVGEFPLHP